RSDGAMAMTGTRPARTQAALTSFDSMSRAGRRPAAFTRFQQERRASTSRGNARQPRRVRTSANPAAKRHPAYASDQVAMTVTIAASELHHASGTVTLETT